MKTLAGLVTVLTLVTLGSAAFACDGFKRSGDTAQNQERIIPPSEKTS